MTFVNISNDVCKYKKVLLGKIKFLIVEHEIDYLRLINMPESMVNELFPKLYPRHQFIEHLRVLKDTNEYQMVK